MNRDQSAAGNLVEELRAYRSWFYAAAAYNLLWGTVTVLFPGLLFDLLGIARPNYLALWQVVGMFVLVYAPAYWWAGRHPERHAQLIVIGMRGKVLGPLGFAWSVAFGGFPAIFGLTILTNDLIWYPSFLSYLRKAARTRGSWLPLLKGE